MLELYAVKLKMERVEVFWFFFFWFFGFFFFFCILFENSMKNENELNELHRPVLF